MQPQVIVVSSTVTVASSASTVIVGPPGSLTIAAPTGTSVVSVGPPAPQIGLANPTVAVTSQPAPSVISVASQGPAGIPGYTFANGLVPVEAPNNVRTLFTLPGGATYVAGSLQVWLNGLLQRVIDDYTETSATTFTFLSAPITSDKILIAYRTS